MLNFINQIARHLKKPFPEEESRLIYYRNLFLLAVFVGLFLYIFEPFGISTLESNRFLICLGFGSMTFVGALIYELSVGQLLRFAGLLSNFTFGKWILNIMATMLFISMANFIFARLLIFGYIQWSLFPAMLYSTFMIGIIPVTVLGGLLMMKSERKYRGIADEINKQPLRPSDAVNGRHTLFTIPVTQVRYVEALQNYVQIGHIDSAGEWKVQTERATLKKVIEEVNGSPIVRCHRSFLVNRKAISSIAGNAQGLLLTLTDCDKVIPVARSYVDVFRTG